MKRRRVIVSLFGVAGALSARAGEAQDLSEETVRQMLRSLAGVEPRPSEESQVRAFLLSMRTSMPPDPETEPAIAFDPEVS